VPAEKAGHHGPSGSAPLLRAGRAIMPEALSPVLGGDVERMRKFSKRAQQTPKKRSAHRKREEGYLSSGNWRFG